MVLCLGQGHSDVLGKEQPGGWDVTGSCRAGWQVWVLIQRRGDSTIHVLLLLLRICGSVPTLSYTHCAAGTELSTDTT
jgi:hypothetical protein